jgi:predicted nuclease of predicted toxin-antitoxin system
VAEHIKFHLDEHVDPDVARALRRHGIDVTTTVEAGLRTLDDLDHLDFIQREGRVVVTHDADFLRYASRKGIV